MSEQKRVSTKLTYFAAFLLPVLMLGVVYLLHGVYPFGDHTVMTGDARFQFVDYLSYLKTIVFGNNDFSYSFSKNLGGNMKGFSAYYYMSVLNFITLLFPSEFIPAAQGLVLAVTMGLCSLTFFTMLSSLHGISRINLIFSIAYAFMGFIAVYFQLSMYFTNLVVFPLIVLGLFRLISDYRNCLLYAVSLFIAVLSNYYSGFMICIFCLLMFMYKIALELGTIRDLRKYTKTIVVFACSSVLSVAMSAFNLLPALLSLEDEKNVISIGFYRTFSLSRLFSKLYVASFKGNMSTGMPNIYCGVLVVFLLYLYFLNSRIPKKERVLSAVFVIFLMINLYFNPLNVIWHGLNQPIGFPYRYSYMLSFLFIYFAYRGFRERDGSRRPIKALGFVVIYALYSVFLLVGGNETVGLKEIIITAVFLAAYMLLSELPVLRERAPLWTLLALLIVSAAELSYNMYDSMGQVELASLAEYREYVDDMGATIEEIKQGDKSFYRMEKDVRRTHNDAMQFDYAGLSHFSSSEKKDKMKFLGKLGLRDNGNWAFYGEPSTMLLDCLMGVRHFVSQFHTTPNNYTKIIQDKVYKGYINESALPIMFAGNREVTKLDYRKFGNDPFEFQQAIADSLVGRDTAVFSEAEILSTQVVNLKESDEDGYRHYEKEEPDKDAYILYSIKTGDIMNGPDEPACLYAYFDAPDIQDVTLYRYDTDMGPYFGVYRWNIVNLETHTVGDTYEISLHPQGSEMDIKDAYFYYEDRNAVKDLSREITVNPSELQKITSSHLKGSIYIANEEQCAVLSIPYDEAWKITVDGKPAEIKPAAGMLLSFEAGVGDHEIDMRYIPKGMYAGTVISVAALILFGLGIVCLKQSCKPADSQSAGS